MASRLDWRDVCATEGLLMVRAVGQKHQDSDCCSEDEEQGQTAQAFGGGEEMTSELA